MAKICEIPSVVAFLHLEPISTDDKALFTVSLHTVPVINGFLSLLYIAETSLSATKYLQEGERMRHAQSSDRCQACRQKATFPLLHIAMFQFFTVCDDKSWRDDRCVSCPQKA